VSDVLEKGLGTFLSAEITNVRFASAGARRRNVLFEADGKPLVATIIQDAGLQIMAVDTEAALLRLAEDAGVAVAHVEAVCSDSSFVGGPFFVTTQIPGETVGRQILRLVEATPGLGTVIARDIGASFAKLHAVDPERAPDALERPAVGTSAIDAALLHIRGQLDLLLQPSPVFELAYAWLDSHRPVPGERLTVVHRDCRNGNIIVGPDGLRAILDWEVAHLGEPMEDLAWVCVRMWRFRNDELEVGGFATRDDLRAGYVDAGGTWDDASFFWWKLYSTLRWGLGLAGQGRSHLDGTFSSIVMAGSGRRVGELEYDCLMLLRNQFA
jgi:aminoglycoside phosphotransferase (APT) family kinase protein